MLEEIADSHIGKNELIIINGGDSPQQIYFTNRKGWSVDNEVIVHSQDKSLSLGNFYKVLIKSADDFDLIGEVV